MAIPALYAIADVAVLVRKGIELRAFAEEVVEAGVSLVQLRHKDAQPRQVLLAAAVLREVFAGSGCRSILNDRADLAVLARFDGVHVGQEDLSPEDVRRVLGARQIPRLGSETWGTPVFGAGGIVGLSTHTEEQVRVAELGCADYVAVGPVFATGTKLDAAPVVGLEGVRRARALTGKPLVAIGGITRENARAVMAAGADSVGVISGLLVQGESVGKVARDFIELLG